MDTLFPQFGFRSSSVRSKLFTWGRNDKGQLGLGNPEIENMSTSTAVDGKLYEGKQIMSVGLGVYHSLLVTADGSLFGSGDNAKGQLNPEEAIDAFFEKPERIHLTLPSSSKIVQVSCGLYHSVCLTDDGYVITFGHNGFGQLGHSNDRGPEKVMPRFVEGLSRHQIIQIACTDYTTMMLSKTGKIFVCGAGFDGVLGIDDLGNQHQAVSVSGALEGVPVCHISAGTNHGAATTINGTVYCWGKCENGQLGVGEDGPACYKQIPVKVELGVQIRSTACGEAHTIFVAVNGDVYACGSNSFGQLGLDDVEEVNHPLLITGLASANSKVVQAACGSNHTVLLFANGSVFTFGSGGKGQLGTNDYSERLMNPTQIELSQEVTGLSAGGETTFAISMSSEDRDSQFFRFSSLVSGYDGLEFGTSVSKLKQFIQVYQNLSSKAKDAALVKLFNSLLNMHALNASFIKSSAHVPSTLHTALTRGHIAEEILSKDAVPTDSTTSMVDVEGMIQEQEKLLKILEKCSDKLKTNLRVRFGSVIDAMDRAAPHAVNKDQLRAYFVLLISPIMLLAPREHESLVMSLYRLPEASRDLLVSWIASEDTMLYYNEYLLKPTMAHLDNHLKYFKWTGQTVTLCEFLGRLHTIRESGMADVDLTSFYVKEPMSWDMNQVANMYMRWKSSPELARERSPEFVLFRFPFLMSAEMKRKLLSVDGFFEQQSVARQYYMHAENPYFILEVSRKNTFLETMETVERIAIREPGRMRRPLRVKFRGEEGLDAGGVRKEYFQMISPELFSRDLFKVIGSTNRLWFQRSPVNDESWNRYELVGIMMGLALYNETLLDVQFPPALYEMLLNRYTAKPTMQEMQDFDADVAQQLQYVIDAENEEELEAYGLNFVVTEEIFGEMVTNELVEGGADKEVTMANRDEYVSKYIEYIIIGPPNRRYQDAMKKGFARIIPPDMALLELIQPAEFELMLCGTPVLNFEALKEHCAYEGGFDENHKTVKRFWKIALSLSHEQKELLLKFATGSPRAPVGGLETMRFKIQRAGPDSNQLPTAHTCFNTLMLPDYKSEEKLRKNLLVALENAEGFGLE